jgi:branched-chain amino acid transport system substrate-binding protein
MHIETIVSFVMGMIARKRHNMGEIARNVVRRCGNIVSIQSNHNMETLLMCRRIVFMTVLLVFICALGRAADSIPIGVFLSLSGNVQCEGSQAWQGIKVAHKMRPTVLDRPIALKVADTKSDPAIGTYAMFRLIERDRVVAVIGDVTAKSTLAGSILAVRKRIPMMCLTSADCLGGPSTRLVFGVSSPVQSKGRMAAGIARHQFRAKTAAVLMDTGQHESLQLAHFFKLWFAKLGGNIVGSMRTKTGDRDFTSQLREFGKLNADIIFAATYATECAFFAKQARTIGIDTPILTGASAIRDDRGSLEVNTVQGLWFIDDVGSDVSQSDLGRRFQMQYQRDNGTEVSRYAALAADAYFRVLNAIARSGQCHSSSIGESLARTSHYPGIRRRTGLGPAVFSLKPSRSESMATGVDRNLSSAIPTVSAGHTR